MKTIIASLAALMLCAACSHSDDRDTSAMSEESTTRTLSGSATAAPTVPRGNTINDHYKLYEMCQSLNPEMDCEEAAMKCHGEADARACMQNLNQ